MRTQISVRSFTRESDFYGCSSCRKARSDRRGLPLVTCRSSLRNVLWDIFINRYVSYLCVIAAAYTSVRNLVHEEPFLGHLYHMQIFRSGTLSFTLRGYHLLVTVQNEDCLDCSGGSGDVLPRCQDLPLMGTDIKVGYLHPYVCEDPAFEMLGEVVRRKDTLFRVLEFGKNRTPILLAAE